MTRGRAVTSGLALATACIVSLAGCVVDPAAIRVPGANVPGPTYRVRIQFANTLNLPAQAKVMANGVHVGDVRAVTVVGPTPTGPGYVDADVDITDSVQLPADTTAQLRQNTVLGDIFIELSAPAGTGATIPPGGSIPLRQTKPALQVEDLMSGIATFVNGGALHQLNDIIDHANAVAPASPDDTARIADVLGTDARDIAANLAQVDAFLDAVQTDVGAAVDNRDALSEMLTPEGAVQLTDDVKSLVTTIGILGGMGAAAHSIAWLAPLARSGDAATKAVVPLLFADDPLDLSAPSNLAALTALLHNKILPFAEHGPKVNITQAQIDAAPLSVDDQIARIITELRMIGVVR
ncbi:MULTISPECIES: MlaD family protein [unclassified Nocardia]|uniref:MlaD family protein n=1 Tax=unclassified Nocardia TaxID=2637762 RepID=UPI001CE4A49D|nr:MULTISPECIES: MlaD family protein [unclassified Nocardia]